ncbi:MAG: sugar phosphate isomerase/epimerase family protein [Gemmataceae bacterium]
MTPCISQSCTLPAEFSEEVAAWAGAGWKSVELWLTKLENYLEKSSVSHVRKMLGDHGIAIAAAAYQGGLLVSGGDARKAHYDHFKQRLELCQALGIPTLLVAADFHRELSSTDFTRTIESLKEAGQWAAGFNVKLGLEFRAGESVCTSLDTAARVVAACGEPNVGVVLDVFHYYKGPSKFEDLDLLTPQNLIHVQLCDLPGLPRELASDAERILPGDGELHLVPLCQKLKSLGYEGPVSLELHNHIFWQSKPEQVAKLGIAAVKRILEPLV